MIAFLLLKKGGEMSESKIMGYARVSSMGQNLDRQLLELKKYVPQENIVVDKMSGKNLDRPGYQALKGPLGLRKGDTLFVKSLDRLSRNKADIKSELVWFKEQEINLRILDLPTTLLVLNKEQLWIQDMVNNILIEVMASLAEQERETIKRRQKEGIEAAKKKGRHLGRPKIAKPENWELVYKQWKHRDITAKQAMELCSLRKGKFYDLAKESDGEAISSKR